MPIPVFALRSDGAGENNLPDLLLGEYLLQAPKRVLVKSNLLPIHAASL
jgi:hypothetical protein